ncbi:MULTISPECIES: hypothetical protein [unclassified Acinetobacter]|uniref:hypothetical protein n=1 Tax=unclassified Acinetobacter TaxID=196816 RepID=UPI0035BA7B1E
MKKQMLLAVMLFGAMLTTQAQAATLPKECGDAKNAFFTAAKKVGKSQQESNQLWSRIEQDMKTQQKKLGNQRLANECKALAQAIVQQTSGR